MNDYGSIYQFLEDVNEKYNSGEQKFVTPECQEIQKKNAERTTKLISRLKFQLDQSPVSEMDLNENGSFFEKEVKTSGVQVAILEVVKMLNESNEKSLKLIDDRTEELSKLQFEIRKKNDELSRLRKEYNSKCQYAEMVEKKMLVTLKDKNEAMSTSTNAKVRTEEMQHALKMEKFRTEDYKQRLQRVRETAVKAMKNFQDLTQDFSNADLLSNSYECLDTIFTTTRIDEETFQNAKKEGKKVDLSDPMEHMVIDSIILPHMVGKSGSGKKGSAKNRLEGLFNKVSNFQREKEVLEQGIADMRNENEFLTDQLVRSRLEKKQMRNEADDLSVRINKYIRETEEVCDQLTRENQRLHSRLVLRQKKVKKENERRERGKLSRTMDSSNLKKMKKSGRKKKRSGSVKN